MNNVVIDKLLCKYLVPRGGEKSPLEIRERLDSIARNLLDKECDRILSHTFNRDDSHIFVKDLKISFPLNISQLDDKAITNLWGKKMASAIINTVANPTDKNSIISFPTRSVYLASFIIDLLSGVAWQRWYYEELWHLKQFDNRGLIKELLRQNREIVEDILLLLTEKISLSEFLRELTEDDAKSIYNDYLDTPKRYGSKSFKELISILTEIIDMSALDLQEERPLGYKKYLILYLKTLQRYPNLRSVSSLRKAVKLTFLFKEFFRTYEEAEDLSNLIERGDIDRFLSSVQAKKDGAVLELSFLVKEVISVEGKGAFLEIVKERKERTETASTGKIVTPYGGLFVLIRTILDTQLHHLIKVSHFPEWKNLPKIKVFLLFLAQRMVGQMEILYESIDPGLLLFAGFKSPPMPGLLKDYIQAITPEMSKKFLESLSISFSQNLEALNEDLLKKHEDVDFEIILNLTKRLIYKTFTSRLRRFEKSKPDYIFKNFLYTSSELFLEHDCIYVKLSKKPLDIVLRLSGFLEDINRVPWLDNRRLEFTLER